MQYNNENSLFLLSKQFVVWLFTILISFTLLSAVFIGLYSFEINRQDLIKIIHRMHEDITFKDNKWNLFYLNSDPLLPGGESHYIISSEGYVIDRWRPISGYLDTSNLEFILKFQTPQTFTTPTQEQWRMLSMPIKNNNEIIGGILVSKFIAEEDNLPVIDKRLEKDMNFVLQKLQIHDETIDVSTLDFRDTQYDISIKVVDKYNNIITKTNNSNSIDRIPNYIDSSYVSKELRSTNVKLIFDENSKEPYLVIISPFQNNTDIVGMIIVGRSVADVFKLLGLYFLSSLLFISILLGVWYYFKTKIATEQFTVNFDDKKGFLIINSKIKIQKYLNQNI